ncbi:hypothetical protein HLRTI_002489 [Halorhabdus tiamatea SARL4B]|uniref:Cox cluster protein n=1 Tax=Halorhabdus tiamatea SARL4B TaxID=1033806 RepID=F7PM84_9EURY|nr:hypothetical protein [Halorhabdus tiamatea]ERJ05511.1 hypothetical protein HLRTI_002489 [Halorhabdus tiamatea SARL4B]CCQ32898.1 hypothetical protein HTIA_0758 [Halorhabdus tiamatea SARL4B]
MTADTTPPITDDDRLLLGAGFAFGVMTTLIVLVLVLVMDGTLATGELVTTPEGLIAIAGIVFAGILGIALYVLAFPDNRANIPIAADDERPRE